MRTIRAFLLTCTLVASLVVCVATAPPASACSLAAPSIVLDATSVAPGSVVALGVVLYDEVPDAETTTTSAEPGEPPIAQCPEIRPVSEVVFRLVQGETATDLSVVQPSDTAFDVQATIPATAVGGPARIVGAVNGEAAVISEVFTVAAPSSPPAPPTVDEPTFTG